MKSFLKFSEKNSKKSGKLVIVFLLVLMSFSFLIIPTKPVQAQGMPVLDTLGATLSLQKGIWDKVQVGFKYLWQKSGSLAFQQTLRTVLNRVAIDTANYVGSGGQGQKPLFVTDFGAYVANIGDEAAGAYLENFAANMSATSGCEKKKADCIDKCPDTQSVCTVRCSNVCNSADYTKQKQACKSNCQSAFNDAMFANYNNSTVDVGPITTERTSCLAKCDSSFNYSGSNLSNSLSTPSFNVCQPSSIDAKLKITLGLAEQSRAQGPDCKATDIVKNWSNLDNYGNSVKALKDLYESTQGGTYNDQVFLNDIRGVFNPSGNDIGIYLTAKDNSATLVDKQKTIGTNVLVGKGGWLDVQNIAGKTTGLPNQAELSTKASYDAYASNLGKTTQDAFVDALNTFLSQTAFTAFNTLMKNLGKTATQGTSNSVDLTNSSNGSTRTGEGAVREAASKLNQPDYSSKSNYDILSQLSICQNADQPGPTDCVIDNKFMQAIAEQKTVMEAVKDGSLNGTWQLTKDNISDAYTLRNISILRKYRILPVGWEVAIAKATEDPTHLRKITLNDLISCFDANGDYKKFSSDFNQQDQDWCRGLVDPNWVLKAPLNSCRKLGIGGQVLSFDVTAGFKGMSGQPDTLSTYNVTRAEDYCADPQTCIKEKNDGSCEAYGYCSEERRTWNFGADSCAPINNTCQTYTGGTDSKTVSYLENTINYGNCNASNSGCRQYSLTGDYANGKVLWNPAKSLFFNGSQSFTTCDQASESCTGLIRAKTAAGTNLIINSDFSADMVGDSNIKGNLNAWPINGVAESYKATIVDANSDSLANSRALKLEATGTAGANIFVAVYSDSINSLVPSNLQIITGQAYTLSADVYLVDGDSAQVTIGSDDSNLVYNETKTKNAWQHISVTRSPISSFNEPTFFIKGYGKGGTIKIYVKNIKFEANNVAGNYSVYGASKIYEKLLPNYLEKTCYNDAISATKDYSLKSNAPTICSSFARKCNKDEVGCELYKSVDANFSVAAKTISTDLCPQECLNYDVYIARANAFNLAQKENLIPATAKKCNSEENGCNEFTNLDSLSQGGESTEYYTELKQCIKPSTSDCASFYAWEGTANGYQLKSYTLKKGSDGGPAVTVDDLTKCNSAIYHAVVSSASYNPDCLEFYNAAGVISYHLLSKTITCSNDCHPYRLSAKNIDSSIVTAAQCSGADKNWDAVNNTCQVCLNGGVYDANNKACLYQAIPSEGKTCNASAKGCREYNGSNGENVRLISAFDFETAGNISNWSSNCSNGLSLSTIANTNNGHSLKYNNGASSCQALGATTQTTISRIPLIKQILASDDVAAQLKVGQAVRQGYSYNIDFVARATSATNLKIYFYNKETGSKSYFNDLNGVKISGGDEWQTYKANLENLDQTISDNEVLIISANNDFYLDNFVLNEISERYYLIKNSSAIPAACYYDNFNVYQGPDYNLGCRQYGDRDNVFHNFRQFSKLCSESGVGCEQLIDTKNYSPGGVGIWNDLNNNKQCDSDEPDCVTVSKDSAIYAVYDSSKQCNLADVGCSRLGQGAKTGNYLTWMDVFKRNNPDNYSSILCRQASAGCESWTDNSGGTAYFKDPGENTCVYRAASGSSSSNKNWYKSSVKRCDNNKTGTIDTDSEKNSPICITDSDCGTGNVCVIDNNDYPCIYSYLKTFGLGGAGNQIPVPDQAVGVCEAKESSCTEYIDPVSSFVPNLVYNPNYQLIGSSTEGWGSDKTQTIKLEAYKLYIFKADLNTGKGDTKLTFTSDIKPLLNNNNLGTSTRELIIKDGSAAPQFFYSLNNISAIVSGPTKDKTITVKAAVVDYQLQSNIDESIKNGGCNGNVNFDQGCILFNERSINGSNGLTTLINNAYTAGTSPATCEASINGTCNANRLIKVQPNRVCSKWLSCVTYTQDANSTTPTCYALGNCNRLSDNNKECANFVDTTSTSTRVFDTKRDKDSSGYSLMNRYYFDQMKEVGINSDFHYDFEDLVPSLSCVRDQSASGDCGFTNLAKVLLVREKTANTTNYPAHGKSFLKVPAGYLISPQGAGYGTSLLPDKDYYLNLLLNTKGSGVGAKVYIKAKSGEAGNFQTIFISDSLSANNGWERKILKFHTNNASGFYYRVELGTELTTQTTNVYFDDLNIEPVLEVAPNSYVARECRLYPEISSLTCGDSLAKEGLEGYCLEHDLKNPNVCSTWYPIDHINSAVTGKATAGYNGLAPLSYCTQVNGNFNLVEKRVGFKLSDVAGGESGDNYCEKTTQKCSLTNNGGTLNDDNYVLWISHQTNSHNASGDTHYTKYFCVPDESRLLIKTKKVTLTEADNMMENCDGETYYEGWGIYDGLMTFSHNCDSGELCDNLDEAKNADPPVRVYDYNYPANDEAGLKLISGSDSDKNFRLTCDSFSQVVNGNGDNMAWSNRISIDSDYPTSTPAFFFNGNSWYGDANANGLARFGRNREGVPFGAAVLPVNIDLLSNDSVKFRNQYSAKGNETIFAGRPYGCSNGIRGNGCSIIGSCSLNPDVYCLLDPASSNSTFNINAKTCGDGGYGVCQPLWEKNLSSTSATNPDYINILKNLFLRTYSSYSFNNSSYIFNNSGQYNLASTLKYCSSSRIDSSPSSFCVIYPRFGTIFSLKLGKQVIAQTNINNTNGSGYTYNITQRGVYSLEFNTLVDKEQQPLKEIVINWGDGTDQVITGQDARPATSTPHIFYHYYNQTGSKNIKITITDNWGFYGNNY